MELNNPTVQQFVEYAQRLLKEDSELISERQGPFWKGFATGLDQEEQYRYGLFAACRIDQSCFMVPVEAVITKHNNLLHDYATFRAEILIKKDIKTLWAAQMAFIWIVNAALLMYWPVHH